jgi:hypothetical protein
LSSKVFVLVSEDEAEELSKLFCRALISFATIVWNCNFKNSFLWEAVIHVWNLRSEETQILIIVIPLLNEPLKFPAL